MELHLCSASGSVCGIGGVDLGYRVEPFSSPTGDENRSGAAAVARLGADFGTPSFRIRPVLDGTSTKAGDVTALVVGAAYRWQ